jgi:hypothetical protein
MEKMLPFELEQAIQQAKSAVKEHPKRELAPLWRKQIYDLIASNDRGENILKWLAIITAERTVGFWDREAPEYYQPHNLLKLGRRVLEGEANTSHADQVASDAWEYYDELGGTDIDTKALFAATACLEALYRVAGLDRWVDVVISEIEADSDLDPWSSDVAVWAVSAFAGPSGRIWTERSDSEKRLEFWLWWLEEAIPAAWLQVNR